MWLHQCLPVLIFGCLFSRVCSQATGSEDPNTRDRQLGEAANMLLSSLFSFNEPCPGGVCLHSPTPRGTDASKVSSELDGRKYPTVTETEQSEGYPSAEESEYHPPQDVEKCASSPLDPEYVSYCQQFIIMTKEIELENPAVAAAKQELLSLVKNYVPVFSSELKRSGSENLIETILNLIIIFADKIKEDYAARVEKPIPVQPGILSAPTPVSTEEEIEIIAEEDEAPGELYPGFIGSIRGMPGEHYPNYTEVPITSFSCSDKKYIPGFYADLETGCQVFHVCYEHRRESFLCPLGTIFNQPILACDYWYSSNCSLAPLYYEVNAKKSEAEKSEGEVESAVEGLITTIIEEKPLTKEATLIDNEKFDEDDLSKILKFLPVKAKITEFPVGTKLTIPEPVIHAVKTPDSKDVDDVASKIFDKIITTGTHVVTETRDVIKSIPEPSETHIPKLFKPLPIAKAKVIKSAAVIPAKIAAAAKVSAVKAAVPVVKAKMVAAAVPVVKAKMVAAAVPVVKAKMVAADAAIVKAKVSAVPVAKVVATKAAVPIAKAKLAAIPVKVAAVPVIKTKFAAVPVAKATAAKAAIPIAKAKMAIPLAKTKLWKAAYVPFVKGKVATLPLAKTKFAAASIPVVKAKKLPLVKLAAASGGGALVKAKVAKAIAISPLTKKALALGYLKLLKAKKLALMG